MKKLDRYYILLALLIVTYVLFVWQVPLGSGGAIDHYDLGDTQARILGLTIVIPYALIWYAAFYGLIKVKQYAALVHKSKDGKALRIISDGLMLLAVSMPLNALASTIRNYINTQQPSLTPTTTIAYNYFSLALTLSGIWLVAFGARRLAGTLKEKPHGINLVFMGGAFTAFSLIYTYITLTDPARRQAGAASTAGVYFLPDWLVVSTIIVPYIALWYLGFRAAYHIQLYRKNAPGILYRQALGYLAAGVAFVVLSLMALRLTTSLSSFLNHQSLQFLLAFVYALLVITGIGYGLIAKGARRLKKIEEV